LPSASECDVVMRILASPLIPVVAHLSSEPGFVHDCYVSLSVPNITTEAEMLRQYRRLTNHQ
jgi:hypothetical protein